MASRNRKPLIFISHLSADSKLATLLREEISPLLLHGIDFFISSDSIDPGVNWFDKIIENLKSAAIVLVLCRKQSISRPWVNFEAGGGWMVPTKIIPLCFEDLQPADLPEPLLTLQGLSLDKPDHIRQLVQAIADQANLSVPDNLRERDLADRFASIVEEMRSTRPIQESMRDALDMLSPHVGAKVVPIELRPQIISTIERIVEPLQHFQQRLKDWGPRADDWVSEFHSIIHEYSCIYATDFIDRSSLGSPQFDRYLRKQYAARHDRKPITTSSNNAEEYSGKVTSAIERTGWNSLHSLRHEQIQNRVGIEIVRILIRPLTVLDDGERDALYVLDFDHRMYGIPLFVLEPSRLDEKDRLDFAIGLDQEGSIKQCYEFVKEQGEVIGRTRKRGLQLETLFNRMLEDPTLKTVTEYLGNVMVHDPEASKEFSLEYDQYRRASDQITEFIKAHVHPDKGKVGLDLGCGTGNYTFPLAPMFRKIIGLDINETMLDVARKKKKEEDVEFLLADSVSIPRADESLDAAWSVSTFHYLKGERQWIAFRELYRVLRKDGWIVIDIGEFVEQHPSLWVKEYFPSLKNRYSLNSTDEYKSRLSAIGFQKIDCIPMDYRSDEKDYFIRAGQNNPERYLDDKLVKANPAFREMSKTEVRNGQEALATAMMNGTLQEVQRKYREAASLNGDMGFVVASR